MSHFTTDILIVIEERKPTLIVEYLHQILQHNNFNIQTNDLSFFCLDELENDEHLEKDYDIGRQVKDPIEDLEKLKSHPGGAISYETKRKERLLVGFTSINDITVNGITFYIEPYFAEQNKDLFDNIIRDIKKEVNILGAIKGDDIFDLLDEKTEIENIVDGKINEKYKYIID
ncbi:hypothetical protein [Chryseobacterium sp. Mn2064]|uniref:hypothetical protein n=1 Tax=Chryseobacterium sp. Mn2064 TaxID=3395263 RepID=UPI003BBE98DC